MLETFNTDPNVADKKIYETLLPQIENLINSTEPVLSNLSNFTAVLKQSFNKISWVGFYLVKNNSLFLGPFQGKAACTKIEIGEGVCGTSAEIKETIIVEDVNKFPGHIACDGGSKSEIVIPLFNYNSVIGVLDLDSDHYSAFNELDKFYLEKLINLLSSKLDLSNLNFS